MAQARSWRSPDPEVVIIALRYLMLPRRLETANRRRS